MGPASIWRRPLLEEVRYIYTSLISILKSTVRILENKFSLLKCFVCQFFMLVTWDSNKIWKFI